MSENISWGHGQHVTLFHKGQIIGLHQAQKITMEIAETTKIVLSTVQCIIKTWKDSGELSCSRKKWGHKTKKCWMIVIGHQLNVGWNRKKGFNLLGSIKIGLWSNGRRSCGLMSPDLPCSTVMHEVMHTSCTSLLGKCYDVGSATLCAQRMRSADYLNILMISFSINGFFSSLMAQAYSKMTILRFIWLKMW